MCCKAASSVVLLHKHLFCLRDRHLVLCRFLYRFLSPFRSSYTVARSLSVSLAPQAADLLPLLPSIVLAVEAKVVRIVVLLVEGRVVVGVGGLWLSYFFSGLLCTLDTNSGMR